jgi:hypothetical protein
MDVGSKVTLIFKPLEKTLFNVGRRIKSTKIRYTWKFELEGNLYEIDLFVSKLSRKRKILINGNIYAEEKKKKFSICCYNIKIGTHLIELNEVDNNLFEMKMDATSFESTLEANCKSYLGF